MLNEAETKLLMQIVISATLLAVGIYFLAIGASADLQKAATGWIGLVAGYWLK